MLWCNEVMISSATWTWRRSFAETVFDFIRHVAPWFYGNANRQAARSWQEGERKGAQTREWKASKEHTEILVFFDTWLWGVRSKWRKLGQRRAKRAKGPSVIELRPPMCRSGHFLSPGPGLRWCRTWLGTVHVFMRSNEDGRERERGFFDAVYPSLPRPTHSLRLRFLPPLINHLCVWVCLKLWIRTYSNGLDIKRAAEVLSRVCVCVHA